VPRALHLRDENEIVLREPVEMAIVAVAAARVPEAARECAERDRRAADPMRIPPHERDARRDRRRRAIDAARRQLRRAGRRCAEAGAADHDAGPTALAQDAFRAMRRSRLMDAPERRAEPGIGQ
jgi:hypothetical protein